MNLETAVEKLKQESLESIENFKKHYAEHIETTDYYPEELSYEEWQEQYLGYIELMEMEEDK